MKNFNLRTKPLFWLSLAVFLFTICKMLLKGPSIPLSIALLVCVASFIVSAVRDQKHDSPKIMKDLLKADKNCGPMFCEKTRTLKNAYESVISQESFFSSPNVSTEVRGAFDVIKAQMESNVQSYTLYIKRLTPSPDSLSFEQMMYFDNILSEANHLLEKLDQLAELIIEIEHPQTTVEDISYVDDVIKALKKMRSDDR